MARLSRKKKDATPVKQVKLKLVHIDFWSAVKTGAVISLGLGVATIVLFIGFWFVLSLPSISSLLSQVQGAESSSIIPLPQMISWGVMVAIINFVAGTLLSGLLAIVYNTIARITGGISVGFTNN